MARFAWNPYPLLDSENEGAGGGGGGKFTQADLDRAVAAAVDREVAGLKGKNEELLGKLGDLKPLKDAIGDTSVDDIKSALDFAREAREKKLRAEGDFDALRQQHEQDLAALKASHGEAATGFEERKGVLEGALFSVLAERTAMEALVDAGGDPKLLLPHLTPSIRIVENEDATDISKRFTSVIVGPDGKTQRIKDGSGTPFTIADAVEEMRADEHFGAAFAAGANTGGGAGNNRGGRRGGGGGGDFTISRSDAQDPRKYREVRKRAVEAGTTVTVVDD